ncbi:hypothetical protein MIR68_010143 [Amoeboaphelidium protococcarum]|nr:hypothetical protein MIR68_010143 [Amoeboaphelidium protococcarum]
MGVRIDLIQHRVPLLCVVWWRLDFSYLLCLLECLLLEVSFGWFICWWMGLVLVQQCWSVPWRQQRLCCHSIGSLLLRLVITLAIWRRGAGRVLVISKYLWSQKGHEQLGVWLVGRCWPQRKAGWLVGWGMEGWVGVGHRRKLSGWWLVKAENQMPGKVLGLEWAAGPGGVIKLARGSLLQLNTDKDCIIQIFLASCWIKI